MAFQDSEFAGDLDDSKNQPQEGSCVSLDVEHLFQKVRCERSKSSVWRSSRESEIISLDAGLRVAGLLALDLWDTVIEVLRSTNNV